MLLIIENVCLLLAWFECIQNTRIWRQRDACCFPESLNCSLSRVVATFSRPGEYRHQSARGPALGVHDIASTIFPCPRNMITRTNSLDHMNCCKGSFHCRHAHRACTVKKTHHFIPNAVYRRPQPKIFNQWHEHLHIDNHIGS